MNKKLGALAFLGAAAVVLAGCSGNAGGTPSADASGLPTIHVPWSMALIEASRLADEAKAKEG